MTAKPFLYVFNVDPDEIANAEFTDELRALVAPAEAIFLDAKTESELIELHAEEALELLQSMGQDESGLDQLARVGFAHPRPADLPDRRAEGVAGLDDPGRGHRAPGGRRHPHRLRARLHQGRDRRPSTTSSTPVRWPRPRRAARCASRARTTSWPTATSWSSASTSDEPQNPSKNGPSGAYFGVLVRKSQNSRARSRTASARPRRWSPWFTVHPAAVALIRSATALGSSNIGTWPQPGSASSRVRDGSWSRWRRLVGQQQEIPRAEGHRHRHVDRRAT